MTLEHLIESGALNDPAPTRPTDVAVCIACHERKPVCCASQFIEQPGFSVFVEPVCVDCCVHDGARR